MHLGRLLLVTLALLAYLGQSLVYAESACQADGNSSTSAPTTVAMNGEHMHHDMAQPNAVSEQGDGCCGGECPCVDEGCHSPIPAIASNNDAQVFTTDTQGQQHRLPIIRAPVYFYKPPILS